MVGVLSSMKFVDVPNPTRVDKEPNQTSVIFENGSFQEQGFEISKVELCLYEEKTDEKLGVYSLITSVVYTDKGTVEMIYDEGFRGENSLERASQFLSANLGISGVVLRSIIALQEELSKT